MGLQAALIPCLWNAVMQLPQGGLLGSWRCLAGEGPPGAGCPPEDSHGSGAHQREERGSARVREAGESSFLPQQSVANPLPHSACVKPLETSACGWWTDPSADTDDGGLLAACRWRPSGRRITRARVSAGVAASWARSPMPRRRSVRSRSPRRLIAGQPRVCICIRAWVT